MVNYINEECMIINHRKRESGDLFLVFFIRGNRRFLSGIVKAALWQSIGEIRLFHYAEISYLDLENETDIMIVTDLKMCGKAKAGKPAF